MVENPVADGNAGDTGVSSNTGIQNCVDALTGYQPLPLTVDYDSSDDDDDDDGGGGDNSVGMNVLPIAPPEKTDCL